MKEPLRTSRRTPWFAHLRKDSRRLKNPVTGVYLYEGGGLNRKVNAQHKKEVLTWIEAYFPGRIGGVMV